MFKAYLLSQKLQLKTVNELYRDAIQYRHILFKNPSELYTYSDCKRRHIMKALAAYSKFTGQYEAWQNIRENYQLKWSSIDSLSGFNNILKQDGDSTQMLDWIINIIRMFPRFSNIITFNVLTGLRPTEAIDSFNLLLSNKKHEYLSEEGNRLEHFKFPEIFLRRTKKSFISLMNENILKLIENQKPFTYDSIRLFITRRTNDDFRMSYCRKIFATFLRNEGVEPELIDSLQGRIPNSVFVRHYYRPAMSKFDEIRGKLDKLYNLLNKNQ